MNLDQIDHIDGIHIKCSLDVAFCTILKVKEGSNLDPTITLLS